MWFEPTLFPDQIPDLGLGPIKSLQFEVGFLTPPGGEIGSNKHVLNSHSYCCEMNLDECVTGNGEP